MSQWWIAGLAPIIGLIGLCGLLWPGASTRSDRVARSAGPIRLHRPAPTAEVEVHLSPPAS
ncbi:MAG: hypothetical protein K0R39_295 [Symbiobacteriaceae bacterium]|jgi:hypothetical protein|nr:hypothetical protein [Symbiobacteriaceae bacterium]